MPKYALHTPDPRTQGMVEMGSALGLPLQLIADVVGISVFSLRRHDKNELQTAATKVHLLAGKVIVDRLKHGIWTRPSGGPEGAWAGASPIAWS